MVLGFSTALASGIAAIFHVSSQGRRAEKLPVFFGLEWVRPWLNISVDRGDKFLLYKRKFDLGEGGMFHLSIGLKAQGYG